MEQQVLSTVLRNKVIETIPSITACVASTKLKGMEGGGEGRNWQAWHARRARV